MRSVALRALVISAIVSLTTGAVPVSSGPPIDLPRLEIEYEYDPPLDSHGYWVSPAERGEWRVVGGGLGRDERLTLDLEIRPPDISVPLEPGPAVLFGTIGLFGDAGGDVATGETVRRTMASVLPACPDRSDCLYRGSITLPAHRLPRLALRNRHAESWISAVIGLTLVRTFAQGTWIQVLPLYDELRDETDGRVGRPRHISSRMLALGASPVGPRELWRRRDQPVLDRIERLRRSIDDPSGLPETQPLFVDVETAPCTPGWTIATATGDVLVDVTEPGPSVPVRVDVPVGAEWIVSVPNVGRAQGTGDPARTHARFRSDGPGIVSGQVAGDPYECEGVDPGSVSWRPASAEEVAEFAEGSPADVLDAYATLPGHELDAATSPFQRLWRPLDPADNPFRYTCGEDLSFTTIDLAAAPRPSDVSASLAAVVEEGGRVISDREVDWRVVWRTDDRAMALAPTGSTVDVQHVSSTDEGWHFDGGGGPCRPQASFGDTSVGRWRLDPGSPTPGPKTRRLHVLGYLGCLGTERAGRARIHMTDDAALIAIPMRSTRKPHFGPCLGPTRMTVTLPKPLGHRTLHDAGSLPIRGANEKLDIVRVNPSGSGG